MIWFIISFISFVRSASFRQLRHCKYFWTVWFVDGMHDKQNVKQRHFSGSVTSTNR